MPGQNGPHMSSNIFVLVRDENPSLFHRSSLLDSLRLGESFFKVVRGKLCKERTARAQRTGGAEQQHPRKLGATRTMANSMNRAGQEAQELGRLKRGVAQGEKPACQPWLSIRNNLLLPSLSKHIISVSVIRLSTYVYRGIA